MLTSDILYVGFVLGHGGDAMQMLELATSAAANGLRPHIIVPEMETSVAFAEVARVRSIQVTRSPLIRADAHSSRQSLPRLVQLFRTFSAPVIHFHTGDMCLPRLVPMAMGLMRLPRAFVTVQSPYVTVQPDEPRARAWKTGVDRHFHRVACPSDHSRRAQLTLGLTADRVQTIHNSVDIARFGHGDAGRARAASGLDPARRWIVFSSRLEPQKRPSDAVATFAAIAAAHPDTDLILVGRGAMEEALRSQVSQAGLSGRVHFAGHQSNVEDWLAAADAWILPTESENFSLAVLEALAAGCPVVSTWCPGNDEVLVDGQNAVVAPVGDVAAMAAGLKRILADRPFAARLATGAKQTAARYSAEVMWDRYARCYGECVAEWKRAA